MANQEEKEAYPLSWPPGWPRTPAGKVERAKFGSKTKVEGQSWKRSDRLSNYSGRQRLLDELARLGASHVVMSTNIRTRQDGLPYSKAAEPSDHGVAVYFRLKGKPRVLACDRWDRVADNMAAIAAHIDAARGQVRWGVGTLEQAFSAYLALPAMPPVKPWYEILGVSEGASVAQIEDARRELLRRHHPDVGGSSSRAAEINAAADEGARARA